MLIGVSGTEIIVELVREIHPELMQTQQVQRPAPLIRLSSAVGLRKKRLGDIAIRIQA